MMSIELANYLFNAGTALVLHGKTELEDADLAQLCDLSEEQKAAITSVVVSGTGITGECFRYLVDLPNLKALYANKTGVKDDVPFECLPKTLEILNLDHTGVGDGCVAKLSMAPRLCSLRIRSTNVTDHGVDALASMPNLRECHVDGGGVSAHARQRLVNAMNLRAVTLRTILGFLLRSIQLEARKFALQISGVWSALYCGSPFSLGYRPSR